MKKNVIFFGSDAIALPLLEFLLRSDSVKLSGIVSKSGMPSGRGHRVDDTDVSKFAQAHGIQLLTPSKPDATTATWMRSVGCDMIFVMAYGHMLRSNVLEVPRLGIYNFHGSILPKYRGASPIEAAIACGETETGVTLMRVVEEMDAGPVADVEKITIAEGDTYAEVSEKISAACPVLLARNLDALLGGTVKLEEQVHAEATFTRKLSKADGMLDFSMPAETLKNRVNALAPHIGCSVEYGGVDLKIGSVSTEDVSLAGFSSGEIVQAGPDALKIATGSGLLTIGELQRPGGKMLRIGDFLNGFPMGTGMVLPSHPMRELASTERSSK
jgi:methionyl-tRNA formyltransferase